MGYVPYQVPLRSDQPGRRRTWRRRRFVSVAMRKLDDTIADNEQADPTFYDEPAVPGRPELPAADPDLIDTVQV